MKKNVIEIKSLDKSFQDHQVLKNINLEVKSGEFLTLLGPSGCGKTTLIRLISGFEDATHGNIYIDGKNIAGMPPHLRHVNTVFQSYALFPHMTVWDNIAFGLRCKRLPKEEINERVDQALQMVKLTKMADRKPHQLSGGQQQRVAIARAVVNQPLVLLLDEPLSALDYSLRKNMQIELKTLQRKLGITFILVTHDQEEALSMSDRVVVMNEGCIEQIGTPREVYEQPRNLYVAKFIGEANIFDAEVVSADEKYVKVMIEDTLFNLVNKRKVEVGKQAHVLIRPEDIQIWGPQEKGNTDSMLSGSVEQVIYKGSTVDLVIRTRGGKRMAATQFFNEDDEKLDFRIGEMIAISWVEGWEEILPHD